MQDPQAQKYPQRQQSSSALALVMLGVAALTLIAGGAYLYVRLGAAPPPTPAPVAVVGPVPADPPPPSVSAAPAPPPPTGTPTAPAPAPVPVPAPGSAEPIVPKASEPTPPVAAPNVAAPAPAPPPAPAPQAATPLPAPAASPPPAPPVKYVRTRSPEGDEAGRTLRAAAAGHGDLATAFARLDQLAGQGDADAQFHLGEAHRDGVGTKSDRVRALAWFMQAAARWQEEAVLARDHELATLDATSRVQAESLSRSLPAPMPAGWLADDATGMRVWSPSWYRNGTFRVRIEGNAANGFVDGPAKVILTATLPGRSDRTFEGRFSRGLMIDPRLAGQSFKLLEADALRLPIDTAGSAAIAQAWRQTALGGMLIEACPKSTPDLYLVATPALAVTDDAAVKAVAIEAVRLLDAVCPMNPQAPARVFLLPAEHREVYRRGSTTFEPRLAELQLYGFDEPVERWSISLTNHAREAEQKRLYEVEQQKKRDERERKEAAGVAAAMGREMPDIRGLKLGLSFDQFKAALPSEPVAWEPKLKDDHKMPDYSAWRQKVTLKDGTSFIGTFASAQNGSKLIALAYEQFLRDGPDAETLRQQLYAKYGKADEEAGNRTWLTWWLRSSIGAEPKGAFLKGRIETGPDQKVARLTLTLTDYGLSRHDEAAAAEARRRAEREAFEKKKSDGVKF